MAQGLLMGPKDASVDQQLVHKANSFLKSQELSMTNSINDSLYIWVNIFTGIQYIGKGNTIRQS